MIRGSALCSRAKNCFLSVKDCIHPSQGCRLVSIAHTISIVMINHIHVCSKVRDEGFNPYWWCFMAIFEVVISVASSGCECVTRAIRYVEFAGVCPRVSEIDAKCRVFRLESRSWGCIWPCSWEMVMRSGWPGNGCHFIVLLWWYLCGDRHECVCWVHWDLRFPSYGIWVWGLIKKWYNVSWATAPCLLACSGGSCLLHCRGQLADQSHWCGLSNCGSLLSWFFCRWYWDSAEHCPCWFLCRPVILMVSPVSWAQCLKGFIQVFCVCGSV